MRGRETGHWQRKLSFGTKCKKTNSTTEDLEEGSTEPGPRFRPDGHSRGRAKRELRKRTTHRHAMKELFQKAVNTEKRRMWVMKNNKKRINTRYRYTLCLNNHQYISYNMFFYNDRELKSQISTWLVRDRNKRGWGEEKHVGIGLTHPR